MNWSLPEYCANSAFERKGGFLNSNDIFQDSANISSKNSRDLNEQKKEDQVFLNSFLVNAHQNKKVNSKCRCIRISDAKKLFLEIISEKQNVEVSVCNLDVNDENFNAKHELLAAELNKINKKILKFDLDIKTPLAAALLKRSKKRMALKKRRENRKAFKKMQENIIKEKHNAIDKLLNEKSKEVEMVKHEAALKRQADSVLHEVRKKKYEAKKMLNLLAALAKLRDLRSQEEKKRGGYSSEHLAEIFKEVVLRFQNLWEKQLEVYKLEEKGLKIMLEENTVPHKKESKFETNLLMWEKALFGDITNDNNEKLLLLPESDIQALILVRRDWDQFFTKVSTPMASGIPPGWVLPPETENELWRAFTKNNKTLPS